MRHYAVNAGNFGFFARRIVFHKHNARVFRHFAREPVFYEKAFVFIIAPAVSERHYPRKYAVDKFQNAIFTSEVRGHRQRATLRPSRFKRLLFVGEDFGVGVPEGVNALFDVADHKQIAVGDFQQNFFLQRVDVLIFVHEHEREFLSYFFPAGFVFQKFHGVFRQIGKVDFVFAFFKSFVLAVEFFDDAHNDAHKLFCVVHVIICVIDEKFFGKILDYFGGFAASRRDKRLIFNGYNGFSTAEFRFHKLVDYFLRVIGVLHIRKFFKDFNGIPECSGVIRRAFERGHVNRPFRKRQSFRRKVAIKVKYDFPVNAVGVVGDA